MAVSNSTFSDLGGAVSDLFAAQGYQYKAEGAEFEKENYDLAAGLADQNAQYTQTATAIKLAQQNRAQFGAIGQTKADVAGAGFSESGSALDILRDSASQGAMQHAALNEQGLITQAGYEEQAKSYENMSAAAQVAIDAANEASTGADITAGIKGIAAVATLF